MRSDEMKRRLNRVKYHTGQRDTKRAFQRVLSEPDGDKSNGTTRMGQSVKRGEPARTKAGRGTRATERTGRDQTRQTGRSQGGSESQPSSECDPDKTRRAEPKDDPDKPREE